MDSFIIDHIFDGIKELALHTFQFLSIDDKLILKLLPQKLVPSFITIGKIDVKTVKRSYSSIWECKMPRSIVVLRKDYLWVVKDPRYQLFVRTYDNKLFYSSEWAAITKEGPTTWRQL